MRYDDGDDDGGENDASIDVPHDEDPGEEEVEPAVGEHDDGEGSCDCEEVAGEDCPTKRDHPCLLIRQKMTSVSGSIGRRDSDGGSVLRRTRERQDYLRRLNLKHRIRTGIVATASQSSEVLVDETDEESIQLEDADLVRELREEVERELGLDGISAKLREIQRLFRYYGDSVDLHMGLEQYPLEVRVDNFSVAVPVPQSTGRIQNLYTSSFLFPLVNCVKRLSRGEPAIRDSPRKTILKNISLVFQPGRSYLLLGPPGSGKTSLLKTIAGLLNRSNAPCCGGFISFNGRKLEVSR